MTKPLRFEPEAKQELEESAGWYEDQRSGLGQLFLKAVAGTLNRIQAFPAASASVAHLPPELPVRQAPVKRFPYHVVYLEIAGSIRVLAIAHDRREPGYWAQRLDG